MAGKSDRQIDDLEAGEVFRQSVVARADGASPNGYPWWHGWVIMDAFIAGAGYARAKGWRPIETAPKDQTLLLWWRPRKHPDYPRPADAASTLSDNRYAEACVIGQVSSHEPGTWWNGQTAKSQDIWHVTHWKPLPKRPLST